MYLSITDVYRFPVGTNSGGVSIFKNISKEVKFYGCRFLNPATSRLLPIFNIPMKDVLKELKSRGLERLCERLNPTTLYIAAFIAPAGNKCKVTEKFLNIISASLYSINKKTTR